MASSLPPAWSPRIQHSCTAPLAFNDALSATEQFDGLARRIIWSPNSRYIPFDPTELPMYFCTDAAFGLQDFMQWPQRYNPAAPYHCAMPLDPRVRHLLDPTFDIAAVDPSEMRMFERPTLGWFDVRPNAVPNGGYYLKQDRIDLLMSDRHTMEAFINNHYGSAKAMGSIGRNLAALYILATLQVVSTVGTEMQLVSAIRDVQRHRRELTAYIMWSKCYRQELTDRMIADFGSTPPPLPLRHVIGCFVPASDVQAQAALFQMGIPLYVYAGARDQTLGEMRVEHVVKLSVPAQEQEVQPADKFNDIAQSICTRPASRIPVVAKAGGTAAAYALAIHNSTSGLLEFDGSFDPAVHDQTLSLPTGRTVRPNVDKSAFQVPRPGQVAPLAALVGTPTGAQHVAPVANNLSSLVDYQARAGGSAPPPAKRPRIDSDAPPAISAAPASRNGLEFGGVWAIICKQVEDENRPQPKAPKAGPNGEKQRVATRPRNPPVVPPNVFNVFPPHELLTGGSRTDKAECYALNIVAIVPLIVQAIQGVEDLAPLSLPHGPWRTMLSGASKDDARNLINRTKADRFRKALGALALPGGRTVLGSFEQAVVLERDHRLIAGFPRPHEIRQIAWMTNEYSVRADLKIMDAHARFAPPRGADPATFAAAHNRLRDSVFPDGVLMPDALDNNGPRGLVAQSAERFYCLFALRDLMLKWHGLSPPSAPFNWFKSADERIDIVAKYRNKGEQRHIDFERAVVETYVRTFYKKWNRCPHMPAKPVVRSTASSSTAASGSSSVPAASSSSAPAASSSSSAPAASRSFS